MLLLQDEQDLVGEEALDSYVLVEKEDVLEAIASFVAAYLATIPEAQHMKPAELQQALTSTFQVSDAVLGSVHSVVVCVTSTRCS